MIILIITDNRIPVKGATKSHQSEENLLHQIVHLLATRHVLMVAAVAALPRLGVEAIGGTAGCQQDKRRG
jgi:hypothetical protein